MPPAVATAPTTQLTLEADVLSQEAFSPFGTVVKNPTPTIIPSANEKQLPSGAVIANQGSAIKYLDVTRMLDLYASAPSEVPSRAAMNMFVCANRELNASSQKAIDGFFPVEILERHPYTTQTFIPLGLSPSEQSEARYLVIVAPSLPSPPSDQSSWPVPSSTPETGLLPGSGLPDLNRIRAFVADGSQAVTYGAGTWHAPMVVVGKKAVDFVVVQFANGVDVEDCQEVNIEAGVDSGISIAVPAVSRGRRHLSSPSSKL